MPLRLPPPSDLRNSHRGGAGPSTWWSCCWPLLPSWPRAPLPPWGLTFVPNSYDGESFVPAAGAWETVGRGATRLHFDHMVSSPKGVFGTSQTGDPAHEITSSTTLAEKTRAFDQRVPGVERVFCRPEIHRRLGRVQTRTSRGRGNEGQ